MKFFFTLWFFALLTFISADYCNFVLPVIGTKFPIAGTTCVANDNKCVAGLGGGIVGIVLTCDVGYYCCAVPDSGLDDTVEVPCNSGGIYGQLTCKDNDDNDCALGISNSNCPSGQYCCELDP